MEAPSVDHTGMIDLESLLAEARELEPLPASVTRLTSLLAGEDWDLDEITSVIELDEALTGRLLGVANSARSGSRQEITSVDQAVMRIGAGCVLSFALAGSVKGDFKHAIPAYGLDEGGLWRHSVAAALAIGEAGPFVGIPIPPEAFASALLHDVGKLVLARYLTPPILELLRRSRDDGGATLIESESEVLDVHHAELGAVIARNWGLPDSICSGIAYHHNPLDAPGEREKLLCNLVGMADAAAARIGQGCGGSEPDPEFGPAQAGCLAMGLDDFDKLCDAIAERLDEVLSLYE